MMITIIPRYLCIWPKRKASSEVPMPYSIAKETRKRCDCARSLALSLRAQGNTEREKPFLASGRYHQLVYSSDA